MNSSITTTIGNAHFLYAQENANCNFSKKKVVDNVQKRSKLFYDFEFHMYIFAIMPWQEPFSTIPTQFAI